tara:strand:+ start:730 stop:1725 length:996 start_codon:yes stop_codon:yes gene_type:complete
MSKARRKMRRALMKKMKKGSLTPSERRDLMQLDREVNKANRRSAGIGGAGLAAALAIASKTGALEKGKDALGEFLDTRKARKEGQDIAEAKLDMEMMSREDLMDGLPKDSPDPSKRDKKKRMKDAEEAAALGLNIEQGEEDFVDEVLDADLEKYREGRMNDLEQAIQSNAALASMFGRSVAPPSDVQPGMFDAGEGTTFDDLPKTRELMVRGEAGPTGDNAGFVEAERVQAAREAMQDFRDSEPTEAEERAARRQRLLDERILERMRDKGNMEMIVGPGREQGFDDPIGLGAMPAGSGIPFRMDGPRVSNEHGGNTPFLMQMRDRIRKKFR